MNERAPAPRLREEDTAEFADLLKSHKITPAEFVTLKDVLGRMPTMAELGVFSAMWSEHCSYKSSRIHLRRLKTTGKNVVVGPGENAGVVRLSGKLCVAFKMESHNHPSYIEPFQGAATGVGGILRDVFCMGARPIAILDALRFGRRDHQRTDYLLSHAVAGIAHYGNCMGIPTVGGNISFDPTYDGNCLVNAMAAGLIHEDRIFKGFATGPGNLVVYVGSATGRDGIHGATMASDTFQSSRGESKTTIQVGDPFAQKLLMEATLQALEDALVVGLQDMGAAGLTSSGFEMAARAGTGIEINLDNVPMRAENMSAYELMLSESQERMLMVVEPGKWAQLQKLLAQWELPFAVIGKVTDTGRFQALRHGVLEVDVPVEPVTEAAPRYDRPRRPVTRRRDEKWGERLEKTAGAVPLREVVSRCLRESGGATRIYDQYDHHIGTRTVLGPEEGGAAVLWIRSPWTREQPHLGLALAAACCERLVATDPFLGGQHAVAKALRMLVATGAEPLGLTDCLNFGNPEDAEVMETLALAIDGISAACEAWDVPVVSGNVSLYNTSDKTSIHPTPMIGAVGRHEDIRRAAPAIVRNEGEMFLVMANATQPFWGGSLLAKVLGFEATAGACPCLDWDGEKAVARFLGKLIARGEVSACRDVGAGGVGITLLKMLIPQGYGGDFSLAQLPWKTPLEKMLGELAGAYVVMLSPKLGSDGFTKTPPDGVSVYALGRAEPRRDVRMDDQSWTLQELSQAYEEFVGPRG